MKNSIKYYIEIVLAIAIIVGLFMPYAYDTLPIDIMFDDFIGIETVLGITIPLLAVIPLLIILIFKTQLKNSILRLLKTFFLLVYLIVFGFYFYTMYDSLNDLFEEGIYFIITNVLSLLLVLLTLKFSTQKSEQLQHVLLAMLSLPIILYFIVFLKDDKFDYGAYIITISFFLLYSISIYLVYKNYKIKKKSK